MSRSRRSGRSAPDASLWHSHKRLRHGVHQVLLASAKSSDSAWYEVLADGLEERGLLGQAERLRHDAEPLLPRAPSGWNTRLRS